MSGEPSRTIIELHFNRPMKGEFLLRKPNRLLIFTAIALSLALMFSACSNSSQPSATPSADVPDRTTDSQTAGASGDTADAPAEDAGEGEPADPFGKYDPAIALSTVRFVDNGIKFAEGESLDNNIWTPILQDDLGITVNNLWAVDVSQYEQKLNVSLASGDLPDFMSVNRAVMQRLLDADLVEDLTDAFERYASPYTKATMMKDGGAAMKSATVQGRLMAIPQTQANQGVASASMIWVRTDWLAKLQLPEPQTMDDVIRTAIAFAKDDPDGNGAADTVGLGINGDLFVNFGALNGFFNGYRAYPGIWVKDASGKLVYGSVQPEMKTALEQLAQLYQNGVIDREFSVKPQAKLAEDSTANRLGLAYGYVANATGFLKDVRNNVADADWKALPIVSADDSPAIPQVNPSATEYFVVKKGTAHPEAVIKLLNVFFNMNSECG